MCFPLTVFLRIRAKAENLLKDKTTETTLNDIEVIDVSKYQPKNVPSLTWRECIKKILTYLSLWKDESARDPPCPGVGNS
jgi:hypothetical protein